MRHIVPLIWDAVAADAARGAVQDRDAYCRRFTDMRPDLDPRVVENVVAEAIAFHGRTGKP